MKILLVDDAEDDIELFAQAIRHIDKTIQFSSAIDGLDALNFLLANKHDQPDLIFIDIGMPSMDGFELLERLRRDPQLSSIPVTMYTTSTKPDHIDRTIELGASFLPKPYTYRELVSLLQHRLQKATS